MERKPKKTGGGWGGILTFDLWKANRKRSGKKKKSL